MSFVPSFFGKFGRVSTDLLNNQFEHGKDDFRNQASIKTQSNGVTIKSTAVGVEEDKINAKINVSHADRQYGNSSLELNTAGKFKGTLRLTKISPGFALANEVEFATSSLSGKVTAEYSQPSFAGTLEYQTKKNSVLSTAAYGFDGVSVGAGVTTDLSALVKGDLFKAIKPDVGVQYEDGSIVTALTYNANKEASFSLFHRISGDMQLATKFQSTIKNNTLSIGGQYKLSNSTLFKAKTTMLNDGTHSLYGYAQYSLQQPNLVVGVSGTYNSDRTSAVGIKMAFGESK